MGMKQKKEWPVECRDHNGRFNSNHIIIMLKNKSEYAIK